MRQLAGSTLLMSLLIAMAGSQQAWTSQQPAPATEGRFEALGEPLESVLPKLSKGASRRLEVSRELKSQRVTVLLSGAASPRFEAALTELLSANDEAGVVWTSSGAGAIRLEAN